MRIEEVGELLVAESKVVDVDEGLVFAPFVNFRVAPEPLNTVVSFWQDQAEEELGFSSWSKPPLVVGIGWNGIGPGAVFAAATGLEWVSARKGPPPTFWLVAGASSTSAGRHRSATSGAVTIFTVPLIRPGDRVFLVDDLGATGRTLETAIELVEKAGARVTATFLYAVKSFGSAPEVLRERDIPLIAAVEVVDIDRRRGKPILA